MAQSPDMEVVEDLRGLSLEELSHIQVSSVARRAQTLDQAPASAFVITPEDIRRSGATTLPEVLRLAPNLNVGRDAANTWSISARGFNSYETANKLLVLIDSRTVYSPLHAGIQWDEEHVLLEDIERIEVISGPGGALWGANAVNGVINVITKSSADTQGPAGRVTYGALESTATARYGGRIGANGSFRVYGSAFDMEGALTPAGDEALDAYDGLFGGVRTDWSFGANSLTFDAQAFDDNVLTGDLWGGFARLRAARDLESGGRAVVQLSYDKSVRDNPLLFEASETWDAMFQHTLAPQGAHHIVWGAGARVIEDEFFAPGPFTLDPPRDTQTILNAFVQDTVSLSAQVDLTVGLKLEDSSYSGFEYMPSARLSWTPNAGTLLWAAVSRAVRTPVRVDRDLAFPGVFQGGPRFESEELIAYEAGYRGRPTERTTLSVSVYVHDYSKLRTTYLPPAGPGEFLNDLSGQTYGLEAWGDYQVLDWWRLSAGVTAIEKDFELAPGAMDVSSPPATGNDPDVQLQLRSRMNLAPSVTLDAALRWMDALPYFGVPAYAELDARLGWRVADRLELSIVGRNLLDESHPEQSAVAAPFEVRRSIYAGARWAF